MWAPPSHFANGRSAGRHRSRRREPADLARDPAVPQRLGDSSLDWLGPSLAEMLRTDIGRSASLRTVPSDRLHQILRDLRISADSNFDPPTLRKLAKFSNADTVIWGQYVKFGNEIRIDATLEDVKRQRSIPLKAQAPSQSGLQSAIDSSPSRSATVFRSPRTRSRSSRPPLQAVHAIARGVSGLQRRTATCPPGQAVQALKKFKESTQADSEFALAYAKLGQTYAGLGYDTEAEQSSRRAVELSERLPAPEKYLINASHARIVNDTDKAIAAYENLAKASPDDSEVNFELPPSTRLRAPSIRRAPTTRRLSSTTRSTSPRFWHPDAWRSRPGTHKDRSTS